MMKNKKAVLMLTALLAVGTISPMAAYGAAAGQGTTAVTQCPDPENCGECINGECPVCTSADCSACGGKTENGVCADCGQTICHTCRETDCAEAGGCSRHESGRHASSRHASGHSSGRHGKGTHHSQENNSGSQGTGAGAHHGKGGRHC